MPDIISTYCRLQKPPAAITGTWFVGVDPGVSGGLAMLHGCSVVMAPMPGDCDGLLNLLRSWRKAADQQEAALIAAAELVTGFVGSYGRGKKEGESDSDAAARQNPGSRAFAFGKSVGKVEMALAACAISVDYVAPRTWQLAVGAYRPLNTSQPQWKTMLRDHARTLYPALGKAVTKKTCDALLLATYCQLKYGATK